MDEGREGRGHPTLCPRTASHCGPPATPQARPTRALRRLSRQPRGDFMSRLLAGVTIPMLVVLSIGVSWPAADEPAYPATEPGRHARDYFAAYNADETAIRAFYSSHISANDLRARPVEQRVQVWHQMRERLGRLTPVRVLDSADDAVTVLARNEHGDEIAMHFHCTPDPPHTLVA